MRMIALILALTLTASGANAGQSESWTCNTTDPPGFSTNWIIVGSRFYAAKGKPSYTVIVNSPSMAIAYDLLQTGIEHGIIAFVTVLDKTNGEMVTLDNGNAVLNNASASPDVYKQNCKRRD
jgi:hypothetical protein